MNTCYPKKMDYPEVWEAELLKQEFEVPKIKKNAHARVVWNDVQNKQKTAYSLVYLHGFTANHIEGYPVHLDVARNLGLNLYLSRLAGHGVEAGAFNQLTADKLLLSAEKALQYGRKIGHKVIMMGTSAGGALALSLAARNPDIAGLILYAPLIDFYDPRARMLKNRWLNKMLNKLSAGSLPVKSREVLDPQERIWYAAYPVQGLLALAQFVREQMTTATFKAINQPIFTGYYFQDRQRQDNVISVSAIKRMMKMVNTTGVKKVEKAFGLAGSHVICSSVSSGCVDEVTQTTIDFITGKILANN